MKRLFFCATILGISIPMAVLACGGSDDAASEIPSEKDASGGDSASGSDTASNSDAPSADGSVADGAKSETSVSLSNPGQVTCGASVCTGGVTCCLRAFFDGGRTETCDNNCSGPGAFDLRCDEKADCPNAGDKCCLSLGGASCETDCPGPSNFEIVLCKTNAECGGAGVCNVKTCANRSVSVCGSPAACN